ncbi:MAG: amino acid ABC transporter permease [Thermomicrobiales bacterium]|nr:MAG: amino acid ABC transporter permease [Thermomicrobiales bacterium]
MLWDVMWERVAPPLIWGIRLPYQLRWEYVLDNREWFIDGLLLALKLALVGLAFGSIIGMIGAFLRSSGNKAAEAIVTAYVELIRNVPLLLLVFIFHFGLPQAFPRRSAGQQLVLDLLPTPERTFMVALSIYAGAYLTEIFRAGIMSVGRRYLDAGRSLGLTRLQMARYITVPIMLRAVLPSLSNTFISLFKDTGIAFFIGVRELSFAANKVNTDFFRPIEGWAAAGLLYLVTAWFLAFSLRFLEGRIKWTV